MGPPLQRTQSQSGKAKDLSNLPAYSVAAAAHYLKLPEATLRAWVSGRTYATTAESKFSKPLIAVADSAGGYLSFINLVEAHVLAAIRRHHGVRLDKVRFALDYLGKHFPIEHPLASHAFETDGLDLFVEKYGCLYNASREGQQTVRELLHDHLQRVEYDRAGTPIKLFPFVTKNFHANDCVIEINPAVSFGRPVIANTGIPIEVVSERFLAGESIEELADDYNLSPSAIEQAIRCEQAA